VLPKMEALKETLKPSKPLIYIEIETNTINYYTCINKNRHNIGSILPNHG
jgi:hypothetical protein